MLTDRQIQAAIKAVQTEVTLNDGAGGRGTGSLKLVVRKLKDGSVAATWFASWKADGQRAKKSIGRYPDMTLALARQKFTAEVSPVIQAGKNPKAMASAADKPTVERLFQGYLAAMRANGRASADVVERALLGGEFNAADGLGRQRLAGEIDASDVSAYLAKAYRRGSRVAADRTRSYLSAAFNWGIEATHDYRAEQRQDWGIKLNPAAQVPRDMDANTARERNLAAGELAALWHGIGGKGFALETTCAARLLIACGQRVRETLRVEGREVDLVAGRWNMPAEKTKGGKAPHTVPLPPQAIEVFRLLKSVHGDGPLFPARPNGRNADQRGDYMSDGAVNRALRRWALAAGIEPFQARDMRRTWKSRAADAGVDRFTRDLIQQHAKNGDTGSRHYDRADYLPQMREAMAKWGVWLENVVNKQQHGVAA
jgi:integrase